MRIRFVEIKGVDYMIAWWWVPVILFCGILIGGTTAAVLIWTSEKVKKKVRKE